MSKVIKGWVIQKDSFLMKIGGPQLMDIPCDGTTVVGEFYLVPILKGGVLVDYKRYVLGPGLSPQIDAIRAIQVTNGGTTWMIVAQDSATKAVVSDACNLCCGNGTPVIPMQPIVPPLHQTCPCADANGNYNYVWALPYNPNSFSIGIVGAIFNGALPPTDASAQKFANGAALLSYLTTNWSAEGTFTLVSNKILLSSPTVKCASLDLKVWDTAYCYTPAGDRVVDAIMVGGTLVPFRGGAITISTTNASALMFALQQVIVGSVKYLAGTPNRVSYSGQQALGALYYNGAALGTGDTFALGACSWTHDYVIPADIGGQFYHVTNPTINGVAASPTIVGQNFALIPDMTTWITTNWNAPYGITASSTSGTNLRLTDGVTYNTIAGLVVTQS